MYASPSLATVMWGRDREKELGRGREREKESCFSPSLQITKECKELLFTSIILPAPPSIELNKYLFERQKCQWLILLDC